MVNTVTVQLKISLLQFKFLLIIPHSNGDNHKTCTSDPSQILHIWEISAVSNLLRFCNHLYIKTTEGWKTYLRVQIENTNFPGAYDIAY